MIQWIEQKFDVVVVGGGTGGMGAAISAARHGAKTALIEDRPVLGGNNSSEIRMHISGADQHALRKNARETGLVEEIALKNRWFNPQNSFCVSDTVYWEIAKAEPNLTLMLNTSMIDVLIILCSYAKNNTQTAHDDQAKDQGTFQYQVYRLLYHLYEIRKTLYFRTKQLFL